MATGFCYCFYCYATPGCTEACQQCSCCINTMGCDRFGINGSWVCSSQGCGVVRYSIYCSG